MMRNKNNQSIKSGDSSVNIQIGRDLNLINATYPTDIVDEKINEEIDLFRKSRFFNEFDRVSKANILAKNVNDGKYIGGSPLAKCKALAWCARLLALTDEKERAKELLKISENFEHCDESEIANAFITSNDGNLTDALSALAKVDSPFSRSTAFMIIANIDGADKAFDWLNKTGIEISNLDSDGKYFYIAKLLGLSQWNCAIKCLGVLKEQDFQDTPALHHLSAITELLSVVPEEFRTLVLNQPPFDALNFPLSSDQTAMVARKTAQQRFFDAANVAQQLDCPTAAGIDYEYALWLQLRDQEYTDKGRIQLEEKLRDPAFSLRLVPLGLQFGIKLDFSAIESEIERTIALNGGITYNAAIARFALSFTQGSPVEIAGYIEEHYNDLSQFIDIKVLRSIQIETLSRAGFPERANKYFETLLTTDDGISEIEEDRLRRIISEAQGRDPIESRRELYEKSKLINDLVPLVDGLEKQKDWDSICQYGSILFNRTHSISDAERLVYALNNTNRSDQLISFVEANPDLLNQSTNMQMAYAWALYSDGNLLESRSELAKLKSELDNPNYRALQINLGIALGDWNSLIAFVANEYAERDKRDAPELLEAAQLALQLGSPHAKDLVYTAVAKAGNDPDVLAAAYFIASKAGWENSEDAAQWLHKATALSDDDGPIQRMTLKELVDRNPDWNRRESETWQLLATGRIPIFLAAQSLNRSLIDLTLFPAYTNSSEIDPRRRIAVAAYSGKRLLSQPDIGSSTIGLEATALLTFSYLDLLDTIFNAFSSIVVPHSTLGWLFEEKQKATYHQPSRIKDAHQVRNLIATGALEQLLPSTTANSDLTAQIGDELALLIAEAEVISDDGRQQIVVRSSPVHRISSLMEEEADLSTHAEVISGCMPIVNRLHERGQITAEAKRNAGAYLQLHEKPWPNQPIISDDAVLFLDSLATTYFQHIGVLEKLNDAGFRTIVSPSKVIEVDRLIKYEGISEKVSSSIGHIRSAINRGIESGKVAVDRPYRTNDHDKESLSQHPTVGAIGLAHKCNAVIIDDRFLNQHTYVDNGDKKAPVYTTIDVLDSLCSSGLISKDKLLECRSLLRKAGYLFVPVTSDELSHHVSCSKVKNDTVVETAELKAIRENTLQARMIDCLQLPEEATWLDMLYKSFVQTLKDLWMEDINRTEVTARSDWLIDQIDIRGWANSLRPTIGENIARTARGPHILMLLLPPTNASQEIKNAYSEWIEGRILNPIKEQFPDLYTWLVEWFSSRVKEVADEGLNLEELE